MKRAILSVLFVMVMCATAFLPMTMVTAKTHGRPILTDDGLYWADDKRVTNNPSPDTNPQLSVDSKGDSHVIWLRGSDYMYIKLDYLGKTLIQERTIATASVPTQHSGQLGKTIGIDGSENFHIIYREGGAYYGPVIWEKYNAQGKRINQPTDVSSGLQMSQGTNLAVARNDNVYVIYDYYPPGGTEREGLTMIDPKGNVVKTAVDVSEPAWYIEGATLTVDWENKLRSLQNVWHGGDQGMWATTLDKYGVRPADTPPQHLYATGSYGFPPMPAMAACPDNAVHLLISSNANGGGTLTYMKLDDKNRPVVGSTTTVTIAASAADYSDIGCDSRNNVYFVWADSGDGKLYYIKMAPGTETKAHKAIKLTTQGTARDPKLALDPNDNLHIVWKDDRNGNDEIYYKFAFNFGVELGMAPEEIAKMMFIHPEEIKSANITIKNLGGQNDTIWLNITTNLNGHEGVGWEAWLDQEELELGPQKSYKMQVYVKGPTTGNMNDNIVVSINATSKGNPWKNDTIMFKVFLIVDSKIELSCPDNVHMTGAGEPTEYQINVKNRGDLEEDVILTMDGPADWDFKMSVVEVLLKPKTSTAVQLTVTPPSNALADEIGMVMVEGRSAERPQIKGNAITHTVVSPTMYINLELLDPEHYVDPGNSTTYTIKVSNAGNMPGIVVIVLEIVSGVGDWTAFLDRNSLGLAANAEDSVMLTVQPPANAQANARMVVKVEGYNDARTQWDDVQATTIVNQVHKLDISAAPDRVAVNPGSTATYEVQVANNGNGQEDLKLKEAQLPVNWVLKYTAQSTSIEEILIDAGKSVSFLIEVAVPQSELAGTYDVVGRMADDRGDQWDIPLTTVVNQIYAIDVTTTLSKQLGSPGRVVFFTILVRNPGNGPDTETLDCTGLPADWKFEFVYNNEVTNIMHLDARKQDKIALLITIPYTTTEQTMTFSVVGTSSVGLQDDVGLVVDVEKPNLSIEKITYSPSTIIAKKPITIEVMVRNTGKVDCENVTVRFYEGDTPAGINVLERFPGGTNKTVVFTWIPTHSGNYRLQYKVDPDDAIIETNEDDNIKVDKVTVRSGSGLVPGFDPIMIVGAIAVVAALVALRRKDE
jgi:uncharacterized membrane protein